jgi:hypothetical protein
MDGVAEKLLLGNCSSVIAPALPYYTPSMVLCVALIYFIHVMMHFLHFLHLTSMDGGNAIGL